MQDQPYQTEDIGGLEGALIGRALQVLKERTGLGFAITQQTPFAASNRRLDAAVELRWEGRQYRYLVEAKPAIDRAITLANAKRQLQDFAEDGLLVTEYMTPALASRCREELQLQFIDTAGNAYLRRPGLYVFVKGEKRPENPFMLAVRGAGTVTAQRVIFTLLCRPALLNAPYREIADAAGVALSTVGGVFTDLDRRGLLIGDKGTRRLVARERLVDEWTTTFPIKLRPKLHRQLFRIEKTDWWKNLRFPDKRAAWGGEVAADRLTANLKPKAYTLYIDPEYRAEFLRELIVNHGLRLRADPTGDMEILDRFWQLPELPDHPNCAPPLLVYADLMATLDPRNIEVAQAIRQRFLVNAAG